VGRPTAKRQVLIVEDDPLVRGYATVIWQELGWTVLEAANADLALEIIDRHPEIDVAFTDVCMPGGSMDGVGLAQLLARTHPDIQVILTSGVCRKAPEGFPLLTKPWHLRDLVPLLADASVPARRAAVG
jgi:CheY-like chemotaxis protein